jgi:signal transduction histidine kinase/CheY-like chemotaxis protein
MMKNNSKTILTLVVRYEPDIVIARQRTRQIAGLLGFDAQDQTRLSTAVSEITRNAFNYAGGGKVEYLLEDTPKGQTFLIRVIDQGPGIPDVEAVLEGRFQSEKGMGLGIAGARRLMDQFHIESILGKGTTLLLGKRLPRKKSPVTSKDLAHISDQLAGLAPQSAYEEIQQQNQEILRTLEDLRLRQEELVQLNRELEDTNRGVLALYAELDEKAQHLRNADELKTRFLSNMSHEFRTPLNSILALSRLLIERTDGPLTEEQEKQARFIRKSTEDLSELVNDLLDLAKVEAGKITVRPTEFEASGLFSTLRGMLRPLLLNPSINLFFDEPVGIPPLYTDEGKVSQILRNFISNALKFTPQGEIRVSAELASNGQAVVFSVTDTGIGIAPEDQERIFQEFTQVEHPLQKQVKGTGLGLPLSKKLAVLLGGSVTVKSEVGVGSTFSVKIPRIYKEPVTEVQRPVPSIDSTKFPVLVIEDDPKAILLYEKYLKRSDFQVIPAYNLTQAKEVLRSIRPFAIILDILLPGEDGWAFLAEMKANESMQDIPILVVTIVEDKQKGMALGAYDYCVKPVERKWLLKKLKELAQKRILEKILVIDDEEVSRYLIRNYLSDLPYTLIEAADGQEGLRRAVEDRPQAILLDLIMPGMDGFEVLDQLKRNPLTRDIPVIVITSKVIDEEDRKRLADKALKILSKETASRETLMAQIEEILTEKKKNNL